MGERKKRDESQPGRDGLEIAYPTESEPGRGLSSYDHAVLVLSRGNVGAASQLARQALGVAARRPSKPQAVWPWREK